LGGFGFSVLLIIDGTVVKIYSSFSAGVEGVGVLVVCGGGGGGI
jgi:hypothetical protein